MKNMSKRDRDVFYISILVVLIMVLWGVLFPDNLGKSAGIAFSYIVSKFGWVYLFVVSSFLLFCLWIGWSKYGAIVLGNDDDKPEYSYFSWFAMLFSAGMAIGLIFWGVVEPLNHYLFPPMGITEGATAQASKVAFRYSYFHWGLHAWANYALLGLAIAYFQLRKKKSGLISSIFIPLIGEKRANGWIGKSIDILAIFATIAGVATDLGLGTLQINSGLDFLYNIPQTSLVQIVIVISVTILFLISAIRGLDRGIKKLSDLNLALTFILMIAVFVIGPTKDILSNFVFGIVEYGKHIIVDSFPIKGIKNNDPWLGSWTLFYWAWWIAWTPFVATFIARISKGRTIKEFVTGVLLVPSLGSIIWFSIFGTMGINAGAEIGTKAIESIPTAYFVIMNNYPFSWWISMLTMILIGTYFVTSADSSTFVLGMMSSSGNPNPSNKIKIIWGVMQSLIALALLLAGGLEVLQMASIVAAFPFALIMFLAMFSLTKALKNDELFKSNLVEIKVEKEIV